VVLAILYVTFTAAWFFVGWLLTHSLKNSWLVHTDQSISRWFVDRRTPAMNSLTFVGSMMADTMVKILVTAVVAIAMLIVWKRWLESLMVVVPLVLEALTFITVTALVGRPRPNVQRLETSAVGSSFPSGHMGAAVVYSGIIVVVFWHTRRQWIRVFAAAVAVLIPAFVGFSRIYRGMHYFTDVVFGALLGGAAVLSTAVILRRAAAEHPEAISSTEHPVDLGLEPVGVGRQ
jgi:undecaprenyl-diphosphatase